MSVRSAALVALVGVGIAGPLHAATVGSAFTLGDGGATLVKIQDLTNPLSLSGTAITSSTGGALSLNELTIRPNTGGLYGYSSADDTFYLVDPSTGVATAQATAATPIADSGAVGFDFNNMIDAARLVTTDDDNVVFDPKPTPNTVNQTPNDLFYVAGDVNEGVNPNVFANAYTNAVPQPIAGNVQYTLDSATDYLTTLGNNMGTLTSVSQLFLDGVALDFTDVGGFDILSYFEGDNTAFAILTTLGGQSLYSFALPPAGGQADLTLIGAVGQEYGSLSGLAVATVPLPAAGWLMIAALGGLGALRARRAKA